VTNASELLDDPRFATAPQRVSHRHDLRPLVAALLRDNTRAYWVEKLGAAGVPCGLIRTVGEVCEAPQLGERGMILSMEHPVSGVVRNIANPVRLDDAPMTNAEPPPMLGQHTREILESLLGLSAAQLEELAVQGVIRDQAEQTT
jgi:crotonobetainyl-CoA:carnitine CoA-transferase CaiB-like acyl-CoA transferase